MAKQPRRDIYDATIRLQVPFDSEHPESLMAAMQVVEAIEKSIPADCTSTIEKKIRKVQNNAAQEE